MLVRHPYETSRRRGGIKCDRDRYGCKCTTKPGVEQATGLRCMQENATFNNIEDETGIRKEARADASLRTRVVGPILAVGNNEYIVYLQLVIMIT